MTNEPQNPASPDDSADWEALGRYYAGESVADERARVRRWLDAHPLDAAALGSLHDATAQLAHASPADVDVEAALTRVKARLDVPGVIPIDSRRGTAPPRRAPARWRTVAVAIAAAALAVIGVRVLWHPEGSGGYSEPSFAAARRFQTTVAQRDSVRLPDGTRVVLAPETRLTVAAGYGKDAREVELRGEAYFDVRHDAARPFLVRAGDAAIRDLGTTFTVRTGAGESVRVAVTSGSVSLVPSGASSDTGVVLRPGDAATLGADGRAVVERGGVGDADTAWTRGRLVFREAPVSEVRAALRRWYGVELRVDSSLADRHLSMTIDGDSVDRVLQVIALTLGAEVERRGDTAVVKPAGRAPRAQ